MMNVLVWTTLCLLIGTSISEEITEEYIDQFVKKIEELRNSFSEDQPPQSNFDPFKYEERAAIKHGEVYDFIIVGAGAAGSVLANRLSEIPEWNILLLEAGDAETPYMDVPGVAGSLMGTKYDWRYITEPQDTWCLGMVDQKCASATGKALGGGTAINGMIFTRGNARDYDLWAFNGNNGWSFKEVLPYFKKAENCALKYFDRKYHHQGGPLNVEESQYVSPLLETFLSAAKELGYKVIDYNGKEQIGFSILQTSTKQGRRNSAAKQYLLPSKNRRNLHIKSLSHVINIIIDPFRKEAIGVKYIQNDTIYIAKAEKEVIISAGPFNSAQLLMISGVGPEEDLQKLHIPVIKSLPVGKQLRDHIAFQGLNFALNISKINEGSFRDQVATWLRYGKGPLATIIPGLGFVQTEVSKDPPGHPDIELLLSKPYFNNRQRMKEKYRSVLDPASDYETFRIDVTLIQPKSTGVVKLKSKDPLHMPSINPRQLGDPDDHDIRTMLAGIKKALELANTKPFQKLGARLIPPLIKECDRFAFGCDDYWMCAARYLSIDVRHQTGTCKMGPRGDKFSVVDNKLKVYGIRKLRVADSSIIPVTITGHTHAASIMIGEKAADLIKEEWEEQPFKK